VAQVALVADHLLGHISSNPVVHRPITGPVDVEHRKPTLATYLESLRQTDDLDLELCLPGHGGPVDDPRTLIQERIAHHDQRKELIFRMIQEGAPPTAHELGVTLWGHVEQSQAYLAISEVIGHTDLLIAENRVQEQPGPSGAVRFVPV
jgi:glyoxylase-like metal-dependent hydrolase (beta-lactamase superfamily II)